MHVIQSAKKLFHVVFGLQFSEYLILLLRNLFEKLSTINVLHYQVDIFLINICFVILYDVGMIQFCQNTNLFFDGLEMILKFIFIQNLDGNLQSFVVFIVCQENFSKCTRSKNLSIVIDNVVLLELFSSLLFS